MALLKKVDKIVDKLLESICIILLIALFVLLIFNVFFRFIPIYSMGWFDEIVELSITSLTFFGAAYLWRRREHSRIDFLQEKYGGTKKGYMLELFVDVLGIIFICFIIVYSINLIGRTTAWSPIFKIPRKVFYASIPISGIFIVAYSVRDIINNVIHIVTEKN